MARGLIRATNKCLRHPHKLMPRRNPPSLQEVYSNPILVRHNSPHAVCASILAGSHLAGIVFETVAVFGVLAVDLFTGQVVARMDKRERNRLAYTPRRTQAREKVVISAPLPAAGHQERESR